MIDMYIKLETSRLDFYIVEQTQKQLRTESFRCLVDSVCIDGENNQANIGRKVELPSSFI